MATQWNIRSYFTINRGGGLPGNEETMLATPLVTQIKPLYPGNVLKNSSIPMYSRTSSNEVHSFTHFPNRCMSEPPVSLSAPSHSITKAFSVVSYPDPIVTQLRTDYIAAMRKLKVLCQRLHNIALLVQHQLLTVEVN